MDDTYRETFENAKKDLENLLEEDSQLVVRREEIQSRREEIQSRTESLRKILDSVGGLLGENHSEQQVGLTDAIRKQLRGSNRAHSAVQVRNILKTAGFPIDDYKQPLAVIHTTLKRLQEQSEIKSSDHAGRTYYYWDGPSEVTDEEIPF